VTESEDDGRVTESKDDGRVTEGKVAKPAELWPPLLTTPR
jgi:hypothetical protein